MKWLLISMFVSVVLAGGTAWLVTDWALHRHGESHAQDGADPDFHAWMHAHLDLTPEQHDLLEPVEAEFEQQRVRLRGEIRAAGLEVAAAISETSVDDVRMKAALARLNQAQGDLQRMTLEHFFAMKRYLRPAQAKRLLEWTHDSLTREH
ncbi:MAG: Spy/CpxP family protein refolding chaperone [Prosthecobacter sp.]|uniref:Spy/CpxP family protein refolding chaperone n=1 Tax=Prosthecobacter sp. TaxID=1965333 RepID=UPI00390148A4